MAETKPARFCATGRRTERVYLQIPIEVQGEQASEGRFSERTHTLIINRDGARISLEHPLQAGENINITNLRTGVSCPFRVVGRTGRSLGESPEWGVECLRPEADFWGIYFPPAGEEPADAENVDVLLECTACGSQELAKLSLGDYRELSLHGTLQRECRKCSGETEWKFGYVQALGSGASSLTDDAQRQPQAPPGGKEDERRSKRLAVKLPVKIRLPDGREEVARTENLSRMGVCFVSDLKMEAGDFICLAVGYVLGRDREEVVARVVWKRAIEETDRFVYGVHLEDEAGKAA